MGVGGSKARRFNHRVWLANTAEQAFRWLA